MANEINSDTLIDIDQPFKVHAGPGAGKTHWLSTHIKHILGKSKRIGIIRKIACISYTNVGAETILNRVPNSSSCIEVATIHSFLYNNILTVVHHRLPLQGIAGCCNAFVALCDQSQS